MSGWNRNPMATQSNQTVKTQLIEKGFTFPAGAQGRKFGSVKSTSKIIAESKIEEARICELSHKPKSFTHHLC